ncbi:polysaccharide deacetylase family protein [Candidatus Sumerlaeota bacterium]|nr:polysaccharide deacetylase family protein [Candidatus Sumerlaeota bacterium]
MSLSFYIDDSVLKEHLAEVSYIIQFFLYRAGIEEEVLLKPISWFRGQNEDSVAIVYGAHHPEVAGNNNVCYIWCDKHFWDSQLRRQPEPKPGFCSYNGIETPVIFKSPSAERDLILEGKKAYINFDIFSAMFYVLTRVEEYNEVATDEHGRFPVEASWQYQAGLLHYPCTDLWVLLLAKVLNAIGHTGYKMALCNDDTIVNLTFDVDIIKYYNVRRILGSPFIGLLRERGLNGVFQYTRDALLYLLKRRPDPYWGFPIIKKFQQELAADITFFVISQKKTEWEDYNLFENPELQNALLSVINEQDDLALHCSYQCLDDVENFAKEKEKLEGIFQRSIYGVRHHYLRLKVPGSWTATAEAGLKYDATLGFAKCEGFRAGTAFPYVPFDLIAKKEIPLIEIPLVVMDVSLRHYRQMSPIRAGQVLAELLKMATQVNGMLSILWHTSNLQGFGWDEWRESLEHFLRECARTENIRFLSCNTIYTESIKRWESIRKRSNLNAEK